jgi:molybdopterin/thiamine biosynthesis adenylyltransferase
MAKQGFETFTVIDNDRIEKHNIGTQMWGLREINGKKVQIMRNIIFSTTGINIQALDKELTEENADKLLNVPKAIIIDSFDNFKSRGIIMNHCRDNKINCLHIGLSDTYAEVVWDEKYKIPTVKNKGIDVCEYPLSRNIAMLATIIGIETIIKFIAENSKISYSITLKDLKINELE